MATNNAHARFWSKVDKSADCWIWLAAKDEKGYGKFSVGSSRNPDGSRRNSMVSAHRFSYEIANGEIPKGEGFHGTCVLHRCDNPQCVRPSHLFLGTNADNVKDMDLKGRRINNQSKGSAHSRAILNEIQVKEIFSKNKNDGISQTELSKEYGVSLSTINCIVKGRLWAHLDLVKTKGKT